MHGLWEKPNHYFIRSVTMQQIILYYFHQISSKSSFPGPFLILVLGVQRKIPEKGYCGGCFKSENKHKLISQSFLELLTTTRGGQLTILLYLLTNIELLVGRFLLEDSMQQSPVLCSQNDYNVIQKQKQGNRCRLRVVFNWVSKQVQASCDCF